MMYTELYQYLINYKQLSVPGIGTFLLNRNPAEVDFPNKRINPPSWSVSFRSPASPASNSFFYWLGHILGVSEREAVIRFNDFAFDMRKQIINGSSINWKGVGIFTKGLAGEIRFSPEEGGLVTEKPVPAEKVIRERSDHMVRVGEDERTSAEMVEMLSQSDDKKSYWWAWALVVGLLTIVIAGWHFSENGIQVSATGNSTKINPKEAPATYKTLP
jgi:hypothetical protein